MQLRESTARCSMCSPILQCTAARCRGMLLAHAAVSAKRLSMLKPSPSPQSPCIAMLGCIHKKAQPARTSSHARLSGCSSKTTFREQYGACINMVMFAFGCTVHFHHFHTSRIVTISTIWHIPSAGAAFLDQPGRCAMYISPSPSAIQQWHAIQPETCKRDTLAWPKHVLSEVDTPNGLSCICRKTASVFVQGIWHL